MPVAAPKQKKANGRIYTAVKMDKGLYRQARKRAKDRHTTYTGYVTQLIVADVNNGEAQPS